MRLECSRILSWADIGKSSFIQPRQLGRQWEGGGNIIQSTLTIKLWLGLTSRFLGARLPHVYSRQFCAVVGGEMPRTHRRVAGKVSPKKRVPFPRPYFHRPSRASITVSVVVTRPQHRTREPPPPILLLLLRASHRERGI